MANVELVVVDGRRIQSFRHERSTEAHPFFAMPRGGSESVTDYKYNRQIALERCQELMNLARRIGEGIKSGPEQGQLVYDACERLGKVLSDLNTNNTTLSARR